MLLLQLGISLENLRMRDLAGQENVLSKECGWDHPRPMGGRSQWTMERGIYPLLPLVSSSGMHFPFPLEDPGRTDHQLTAVG